MAIYKVIEKTNVLYKNLVIVRKSVLDETRNLQPENHGLLPLARYLQGYRATYEFYQKGCAYREFVYLDENGMVHAKYTHKEYWERPDRHNLVKVGNRPFYF